MTSSSNPCFQLWAQSLHNSGSASDAAGYDAEGQVTETTVDGPLILKQEAQIRDRGKRIFPPSNQHTASFVDFFTYNKIFVLRMDSGDLDSTGAASKGRVSRVICTGPLPSATEKQEWAMSLLNALRHFCEKTERVSFCESEVRLKQVLEAEVLPKIKPAITTAKKTLVMFILLVSVLFVTWLGHR